jgi:hypothetical protein
VVDLAMGYVQRRDTCELHCSVYQNRGVAHDKPARESTRQNIEKEFSREKRATMIICFLPFRPSWHQLPWHQPPSYRRRLLPFSYDEMKPCNEAKNACQFKWPLETNASWTIRCGPFSPWNRRSRRSNSLHKQSLHYIISTTAIDPHVLHLSSIQVVLTLFFFVVECTRRN